MTMNQKIGWKRQKKEPNKFNSETGLIYIGPLFFPKLPTYFHTFSDPSEYFKINSQPKAFLVQQNEQSVSNSLQVIFRTEISSPLEKLIIFQKNPSQWTTEWQGTLLEDSLQNILNNLFLNNNFVGI